MRVSIGMIVFNGANVLQECIESLLECPEVEQCIISEGPVGFFVEKGFQSSADETNDILQTLVNKDSRVSVHHGQFNEKTESCQNWFQYVNPNTDYVLCVDSDEVHKPHDISKLCNILQEEKYTSVGFRSDTFFGGFDHILTGFEQGAEFKRMFKVYPGSRYGEHRPPQIVHNYPNQLCPKHLDMDTLQNKYGITMPHYSYVFPRAVKEKVEYYKAKISTYNCIDDYFEKIWLPWVKGDSSVREIIEKMYRGVHEFKPEYRGECYPQKVEGYKHPLTIEKNLSKLKQRLLDQLNQH